ncbi:MAG TPA: branched-chain amino acid ABC transporter permease [Acidimicrobiia bacterium]|nr:branched-chain amino acid ABC transporter permease [Acidimicrobiia bacterium]
MGDGRRARLAGFTVVAVAAVAWPFLLPRTTHFYGALATVYALVALSLVVLSGWTGQISLGHAAFLGLGVYVGQRLLHAGVPLVVTLPAVALLGGAVSLVLGIPSLRLRGVYLTIVTLAFGAACERWLFALPAVRGYKSGIVPRASLLGFPTTTDRGLYLVGLAVLGLSLAAVHNLRRSDVGRAWFALRDSEDAAAALGIRVAPYKIGAFALSAALTTTAGVLYGMLFQATPGPSQFGVLESFFLLGLPVVGGIGSVAGAVVGGALFATAQPVVNEFGVRLFLATGVMLAVVTLSRTDGVVGAVTRLVRAWRAAGGPAPTAYGSFAADVPASDGASDPPVVHVPQALPAGTRLRLRFAPSGGRR